MIGTLNAGNPWGRGPSTTTPAVVARSDSATTTVATTTAIRRPGTRGQRFSNRMTASVPAPIANAATLVLPASTPSTMAHAWRPGPSALTENPRSFGI